jgi:predicted phage gp36 major capsid-like protein
MVPDGRRGVIWGEHVDGAHDIPPSASEGTEEPPSSPGTLQDEIRELRADLERLRTDASVARRDDIDRLAERVEALTRTQQELGGLIEAGSPSVATPVDGSAVAAGTFLTVGLILGWLAARFTQGRRERRSRIRV